MWRRYYYVAEILFVEGLSHLTNHGKWAIFFNEDSDKPGTVAYQKYFRTEKHAERAAIRLYKREFGQFEELFIGDKE